MNRRAFTIVELIITITIMGILLGLAFVSMSSSEMRARDTERKTDVDALATHLETYYNSGSDTALPGRYPSTSIVASEATIRAALRDIDFKSVTAPGSASVAQTFVAATNATQTTAGVTPQPTFIQYVYQPLSWNGSAWALCTGSAECRKFNLYYRLENDSVVYQVKSKHQ